MAGVQIDVIKVRHWLNARKLTTQAAADHLHVPVSSLTDIMKGDEAEFSQEAARRLARLLDVDLTQLAGAQETEPDIIVMSAGEMYQTRRPLQRDGIHFYNYYSMAAPGGHTGPVILDILCPAGRPPKLNNGHLEPAITVNLGPGDITGRWGGELDGDSSRVMLANRGLDQWIIGDSYVEPTYCPHSYGLASQEPARIISYTAAAPLGPLVAACDRWADRPFDVLLDAVATSSPGGLLGMLLARRGYEAATADDAAGLAPGATGGLLAGTAGPDVETATALGRALGFDYRLLLPSTRTHDSVGKTYCSVEESRATVRRFRGYTVASMARASHLTDLVGMFMLVSRDQPGPLDLVDVAETHYLVLSGSVTLWWEDAGGQLKSAVLGPDGSAWAAPCVTHGWSGAGALARLGSGQHVSYLDQFELSNTFEPRRTLARARRDRLPWGYDVAAEIS